MTRPANDSFTATTYQYDEIGNLISFTDAENHITIYDYHSLFGLTKVAYPNATYEEYQYDNIGNTVFSKDANGNQTTYTYDSIYRITQIQYQDQSTVSFTYDLNSNRIQMDDDAPNTGDYVEFGYDPWDRLSTKTRHISQDTYTISYEYDTANRLTKLTYPSEMQILYSYDNLNRIMKVKRYVDGTNDKILANNFHYNPEDLVTQFDYGNDLQATFSYDTRDRPLTIDVKNGEASFLDLDYTYDSSSNITQLVNGWRDTSSAWHSDTESYSYDGLDRLTSGSCTSWSHSYSYDKVGNRTTKDSITYTINAVNEVTALSNGTLFTYDDNGNRTQKTKGTDTWDYTYDYANRLTKVEKNSMTIGEYVYDGDGNRIQVMEDGVTTTYIYSGFNMLYEENTTGTASYIYGPTGRLAKRTTVNEETNTFYYHADHLGSTRLVTDECGDIVTAVTYHPFGEINMIAGSEDYLFTGKEMDETGLYYYGARFYDPEIGRFVTRDLLRGQKISPQTLNRYNYCLNNPSKFTDPDGLKSRYCFSGENEKRGTLMSRIGAAILIFLIGLSCILTCGAALPLLITLCFWAATTSWAAIESMESGTTAWEENIDEDDGWERIIVTKNNDGTATMEIIDDDGTIYRTEYNEEGEIVDQFRTDPDGTSYWWDDEKEEWRVDQNQNGIPDDEEEQDNSTGNSPGSPSEDSGGNGGGAGGGGGGNQCL